MQVKKQSVISYVRSTLGFCCLADVEVVHELLNLSMGHLNSRDMAGSSPLHDAVWGGHLRVAEARSH